MIQTHKVFPPAQKWRACTLSFPKMSAALQKMIFHSLLTSLFLFLLFRLAREGIARIEVVPPPIVKSPDRQVERGTSQLHRIFYRDPF